MSKVQRKTDIATEATRHYSAETQIPQNRKQDTKVLGRQRERETETTSGRQTKRQRKAEAERQRHTPPVTSRGFGENS